jgi:hypothetical protein
VLSLALQWTYFIPKYVLVMKGSPVRFRASASPSYSRKRTPVVGLSEVQSSGLLSKEEAGAA